MFRGIRIDAETGNEDTSTAVTIEDVDEFILEADAEINARLFDYYTTPITGTEALLVVGKISKYKVAHVIKTILEATTETSDRQQDVQINLEKKANELLDNIIPKWDSKCCEWIDPIIQLSDANRKATSPKTAAVFKSNAGTVVIKKGGDNW
jgi:hypothetical protein